MNSDLTLSHSFHTPVCTSPQAITDIALLRDYAVPTLSSVRWSLIRRYRRKLRPAITLQHHSHYSLMFSNDVIITSSPVTLSEQLLVWREGEDHVQKWNQFWTQEWTGNINL